MIDTNHAPPDFDTEFNALAPIWSSVWDAAEHGCESARHYFLDLLEAERIDPSLAPEIQRYHAKNRLREKGISNAEFTPYTVGRNGIAFGFRNRHIKVWKRGHQLIPRAGNSRAKFNFLGQQSFLPLPNFVQVVQPNRFILYETDAEFRLLWLWYGLPLGAKLDGSTEVVWIKKVTFDQIALLDVEPFSSDDLTESDNLPLTERDDPEEVERDEEDEQGAGS